MPYKLLDWIDITQIRWDSLSENPAAIDLLKEHPEQIVWYRLCSNQNPGDKTRNESIGRAYPQIQLP
jgi:hypothetical protein